jgi:PKD repeat protein
MRKLLFIYSLVFLLFHQSEAQQLAGGEIYAYYNGKLHVHLSLYTTCYSSHPYYATVYIKCARTGSLLDSMTLITSSPVDISDLCSTQCTHCSQANCSFPYGYRKYSYSGYFEGSSFYNCDSITVFYKSKKRLPTLTTAGTNSDFYLDCQIVVGIAQNLPIQGFNHDPLAIVCRGQDYFQNFSLRNNQYFDSVVYEMTDPKINENTSIQYAQGYSYDKPLAFWGFPDDGLNYPRGFHFESQTANMYFRPQYTQEAPMAIKASIYHNGRFIANMKQEWVLKILSCNSNFSPVLSGPFYRQLCANMPYRFTISARDFDAGDTLIFDNSDSSIQGYSVISQDYSDPNNPTQTVEILPYYYGHSDPRIITFTVKDNKCPIQGKQTRAYQFDVKEGIQAYPDIVDSGCGKYQFSLNNINGQALQKIEWKFDDQVVSTDTAFIYQFFAEDTLHYSFELTAINGCSYYYSDEMIISVTRPKVFAGVDDSVCYGGSLYHLVGDPFPSVGLWQGTSVFSEANQWYFNPDDSQILPNTGYELIYSYTASNGCSNSDTLLLYVLQTPKPDAGDSSVVCENASEVLLKGQPAGGTWSGAGVVNGKFDPTIGHGAYYLSYEVSTNGQCPNTDTLMMRVAPLPEIHFKADPVNGEVPLVVNFTDSSEISSGSIQSYYWNFGDGDTSRQYGNVQHTYTDPGLYSVILFCESDYACSDFGIASNIVNPWPVSIDEAERAGVQVFPNPAHEFLYIKTKDDLIQSFRLMNQKGHEVAIFTMLNSHEFKMNTTMFKGVYLLIIQLEKGRTLAYRVTFL